MRVILSLAISADSFIAKPDGDSDWVSPEDEKLFVGRIQEASCYPLIFGQGIKPFGSQAFDTKFQRWSDRTSLSSFEITLQQRNSYFHSNMSEIKNEEQRQEWERLYGAANKFFQLAPWNWMADDDLFALVDPQIPETLFGCVMGQLGEHIALAGYIGDMGMRGYFQIATGTHDESMGDMLGVQHCLMASFEDRDALEPHDRNVIVSLNRRYRGKQAWPLFREYKPGFYPWFLAPRQVVWLTTLLEQSLVVAEYAKEHRAELGEACRSDGKIFARVLRNPHDEGSWETTWLPFNPEKYIQMGAVPLWQVTETNLSSLAQSLNQLESFMGIWEVEVFYGSMTIQERNDVRPYFPPVILIVEHDSGFILGTVVTDCTQDLAQAVMNTLVNAASTHEARPKKILVKQEELYILLSPLEEQAAIMCELVDQLPSCQEAKNTMDIFMRRY